MIIKDLPDAASWASVALDVLATEYPYGSGHTSLHRDDNDVTPALLHPSFHGALDWHSSAHMQWSLVRLLTLAGSDLDSAGLTSRVCGLLDQRLTSAAIGTEIAYLEQHPGFERPYGWAWAAMLAAAAAQCPVEGASAWADATADLAATVGERLLRFLPKLTHPVRHGVHSNTAFAMILCHQAFGELGRRDVVAAIEAKARSWFGTDTRLDTRTEPSGTDFLSSALCEAELMRRVLPAAEFDTWFAAALPDLGGDSAAAQASDHLLEVPGVSDQSDGQLAHLHGLALSRSWLLTELAGTLPAQSSRRRRMETAATAQYQATATVVVFGDFMATHWLVSFALLAATA
ncbi:MAG: hypothetical protein JWN06_3831 [Propionibacteriaceae bacterium]|nr:hypothetical protein [Propionibacteriaceae bacterium]